MTNVPFEEWARPKVGDLLCFAEGSDQRGSRVADLFALVDENTASRVTVWAADILSLMQSAFEEGWEQGAADLLDYQRGTGRYGPKESPPFEQVPRLPRVRPLPYEAPDAEAE